MADDFEALVRPRSYRGRERRAPSARDRDFRAGVEDRDELARVGGYQSSHASKPDERAPVRAGEPMRAQPLLEQTQRLAQQVAAPAGP